MTKLRFWTLENCKVDSGEESNTQLMAKHTVVTMPVDGIGNQVMPEALRVLKAVGFDAEYVHADDRLGVRFDRKEGNALPDPLLSTCSVSISWACLALSLHQTQQAQAELQPELRGKGLVYYEPDCDYAAEVQPRYLHAPVRRVHRQPAEFYSQEGGRRLR